MDKYGAYSLLFTDSLTSSIIFMPSAEYVVDAMKTFGTYDLTLMLIIATIGATCGSLINWTLGLLLRKSENTKSLSDRQGAFKKGEKIFKKYFFWTPILSFIPLWGALIVAMSGVFRTRVIITMALVLVGRLGYYALKLF